MTGAFVGRSGPLRELERFVRDAASGRGGLVLVSGEAGIGKTTTVERVAAACPEARALWGSCWDGEGAPALWPWIQILRALVPADAPASPTLGRLLPERGAAPAEGPLDEQARFQLFDAVRAALRASAEARPLLLVLDDLHWADAATLRLLGFLVPELRASRVAVIGTYRHDEGTPELEALVSMRVAIVHLDGLDPEQVGALVHDLAEGEVRDAAAIHAATGGNPFFVRELLRLPEGKVPESVREVLRRRLERASPAARALLDAAAVLGPDARLDVLERVAGVEGLADALATRLVHEGGAGGTRLRFAHALVREVLYRDLAPERRLALHRAAGEALEALGAGPSELAHHFVQAARLGATEKAIAYCEAAGRSALAMLAYEPAVAHFETALALLDGASPEREARLRLAHGRALRAAGRTAESHDALERAFARAASPTLRAAIALEVGIDFTAGVVDETEVRLLERALAELPADDSVERARVMARLAKALLFTPHVARRAELSEAAAAMARRLDDPATLGAVLFDRHVAVWGGPEAEERLAIADEIVEIAERLGDGELSTQGRALRMGNLLELGDVAALGAEVDAYDAIVARLSQPHYLWHVPLLRASLAALGGRFDAVEPLAEQGLALGRRAQHQGAAVFYAAVISVLRFGQGRFGELVPMLRQGAAQWPSLVLFRAGLACALAELGHADEARVELERLTADRLASVPRDFTWVATLAMLAITATSLEDRAVAALVYELLAPHRAHCVRLTRIGIGSLGSVEHYLGLLAGTLGRWEDAASHLERAIERNQRLGAPAYVANARAEYARALAARGEPERARAETQRAEVAAEALGFRLWRGLRAAPIEAAAPAGGIFARDGETWTLRLAGPTLRLKDSVGLGYLAKLVAADGREVHVIELSAAAVDAEAGAPLLDAKAKEALRRRVRDLEEEIREAEEVGQPARAARARDEIARIAEHVAKAVGLGGRDRRAASEVERARVRVKKAIRAAIRRVAEHDPDMAGHLERSVRTGTFCAYAPDPEARARFRA